MKRWIVKKNDFRVCIRKVTGGGTVKSNRNGENLVTLGIPFYSFRILGFLDDTEFRTIAPWIRARRRYGFDADIQKAFYSCYFSAHGIKVQDITLPNGLIGSIYIVSLCVSDSGLLNVSSPNTYLINLFLEHNIKLPRPNELLPVVYGYGIFPVLPTILPRFSNSTIDENRINTRLASVR